MEKPKKRGRPPNTLRSETRVPFNIRITPAVKEVIERQAEKLGHTQSQEVVRLIELGLLYETERRIAETKGGPLADDIVSLIRTEIAKQLVADERS